MKNEKQSILSVMAAESFNDLAISKFMRLLKGDMREAVKLMSCVQARYLVDMYYQLQKIRIATNAQVRSLEENSEPADIMRFTAVSFEALENILRGALGDFASEYRVGAWMQSICGIGPVLSAGFLATFDIRNRKTASSWWRFAGLDPTMEWKKGQKRPFNARAKVLCYKLGECFVKVQNNDADIYGKLYAMKKLADIENNAQGLYAGQAAAKLERFKIGKNTDAYKAYSDGKLPPAHLHARARRYVAKIFLSHLHDVSWVDYYGSPPPVPFVFSDKFNGGVHQHFIAPQPIEGFSGKSLRELYPEDEPITPKETEHSSAAATV